MSTHASLNAIAAAIIRISDPPANITEKELARVINEALHANEQPPPQTTANTGRNREPPGFSSIGGFCARNAISRSTFYKWMREGLGPHLIYIGKLPRIAPEDEMRWRSERRTASDQAAAA